MPYPGYTTEEVARRGRDIYERDIRAKVESEHAGRFLVVDIITGDYEIADEDLKASERLLGRRPDALLYGQPVGESGHHSARIGSLLWRERPGDDVGVPRS